MIMPINDAKKIRARIKRYERALQKDKEVNVGQIRDGAGKRFLLGPLYMLMGDLDGALRSFRWFEEEFSELGGEPVQYLCWTLALYRSGDVEGAGRKLLRTMLSNLYILPRLLGIEQPMLDIWHTSNVNEPEWLDEAEPGVFDLWNPAALSWATKVYSSERATNLRERYIEIHRQLNHVRPGPERSRLVEEASRLERDLR